VCTPRLSLSVALGDRNGRVGLVTRRRVVSVPLLLGLRAGVPPVSLLDAGGGRTLRSRPVEEAVIATAPTVLAPSGGIVGVACLRGGRGRGYGWRGLRSGCGVGAGGALRRWEGGKGRAETRLLGLRTGIAPVRLLDARARNLAGRGSGLGGQETMVGHVPSGWRVVRVAFLVGGVETVRRARAWNEQGVTTFSASERISPHFFPAYGMFSVSTQCAACQQTRISMHIGSNIGAHTCERRVTVQRPI